MQAFLDVGGSHFRYLIRKSGEHIDSGVEKSAQTDLITFLESLLEKYDIHFVGISFAGQVHEGVILSSPNLTYKTAEIQNYFQEFHNIPVRIENDLKCAALAESQHYPDSKMLIAAYPGTGFGSAAVFNGQLISGAYNLAGEVGHIPYKYSELPCGCGGHYCVEAFCSGAAIQKWAKHLGIQNLPVTLESLKQMESAESRQILQQFHEAFMFALGALTSILNPDRIILGGGVVTNNPYLLEYARENITSYALPKAAEQLEITLSTLDDAPMQGAAALYEHYCKEMV